MVGGVVGEGRVGVMHEWVACVVRVVLRLHFCVALCALVLVPVVWIFLVVAMASWLWTRIFFRS